MYFFLIYTHFPESPKGFLGWEMTLFSFKFYLELYLKIMSSHIFICWLKNTWGRSREEKTEFSFAFVLEKLVYVPYAARWKKKKKRIKSQQ